MNDFRNVDSMDLVYFQMSCLDENGCISPEMICDGKFDCADESDEQNCRKYLFNGVETLCNVWLYCLFITKT